MSDSNTLLNKRILINRTEEFPHLKYPDRNVQEKEEPEAGRGDW